MINPEPHGEPISAEDAETLQLLDGYLDALTTGSADARGELLRKHPALQRLVDCLEDLDRLAIPADTRDETAPTLITGLQLPLARMQPDGSVVQQFGRYELLEEVDRGGMGVVYRAKQEDLDRTVALKMIRSSQFASEEEVRRFYAEAKAAGSLMHPHIIGIHEVGEVHSQPYFAMDFVEGPSLEEVLRAGPMAAQDAANCLVKVARAVEHLHANNVIHRDLKPANILLNDVGHPYVTDFGLAKVFESDDHLTRTGTIMGTPGYMSPEQAAGRGADVSPLSDVYSLGAILYAMLTGRPVFNEANPLDTVLKVLESEPDAPSKLNPTVPRELESICLRCLEKDPRNRYPSAASLADDVDRFLRSEPVWAGQSDRWQQLRRWVRREPALVSRLFGLGAASLVVQANYMYSGGDWSYHKRIMVIFLAWAVASVLFQQLLNRECMSVLTRLLWAVADATLLTALLFTAHEPLGPPLIGYPMLIVASGLFFRVRLVWFMTGVCLVSYSVLVVLRGNESPQPHYPFIFAAVLAVMGFVVACQVYRMRVLSRCFESRHLS